jgi:hypothetical protein
MKLRDMVMALARCFRFRLAASVLVVVAVASSGLAQVTPSGKGYLFRAKYAKGEVRKYTTTSTIFVSNKKQRVDTPFTVKVLAVKKGVADIELSIGPIMAGTQRMREKETVRASVNSRGEPVGEGVAMQQFGQITFPQKPIRVGESWKTSVEASALNLPMKIKGEFKLVGFKTKNRQRVALLAVSLRNDESFKTRGKGTMEVATSNGSLVRSNMDMQISLPQSGQKTMPTYRVSVVITRK